MLFISHCNRDVDAAEAVCAALESAGNTCWLARRDIGPGEEWLAAILRAIESSQEIVLLFSAYANRSPQVRREMAHAVRFDRPIRVIRLDSAEPVGVFRLLRGELDESPPASVAFEDRLAAVCQSAARSVDDHVPDIPNALGASVVRTGLNDFLVRALRINYWIAGIRLCLAAMMTVQASTEKTALADTLSYEAFALPLHFAGITWVIVTLSAWIAAASVQKSGVTPEVIWRAFVQPGSFLTKPGRLLQGFLRAEGRSPDLVKRAGVCWSAIAGTLVFSLAMLIVVGWDDVHPLAVLIPDMSLSVIWCVTVGMTRRLAVRAEEPQLTSRGAAAAAGTSA